MPRNKTLHLVVTYGETGYHINDLGETKSPRFELYYEPEAKVIFKTNNPIECNEWMKKNIWGEFYGNQIIEEDQSQVASPKRRSGKDAK